MVLRVEDEDNRVADGSFDSVGNENEAGATTNSNLRLLAKDLKERDKMVAYCVGGSSGSSRGSRSNSVNN